MNTEICEISIQEDINNQQQVEEEPKKIEKKNFLLKNTFEISPEDIELFTSYAELSEINTKDNFHLAIVNEEIQSEIKESGNDEFNDYLNFKIDTRKLLRDFDDDEEENDVEKEIEPEIIEIIIIEEYLDEYQPPATWKCIHYKEFRI